MLRLFFIPTLFLKEPFFPFFKHREKRKQPPFFLFSFMQVFSFHSWNRFFTTQNLELRSWLFYVCWHPTGIDVFIGIVIIIVIVSGSGSSTGIDIGISIGIGIGTSFGYRRWSSIFDDLVSSILHSFPLAFVPAIYVPRNLDIKYDFQNYILCT